MTYMYLSLSIALNEFVYNPTSNITILSMLTQIVSAYGADSIAGGGASLSWKFSWLKMLEDPRCVLGADELDSSLRRDIYRTK